MAKFTGRWSRQATPDWDEGDASLPPRTARRHIEERRRVADEEETVFDAAETGSVGSIDRGTHTVLMLKACSSSIWILTVYAL